MGKKKNKEKKEQPDGNMATSLAHGLRALSTPSPSPSPSLNGTNSSVPSPSAVEREVWQTCEQAQQYLGVGYTLPMLVVWIFFVVFFFLNCYSLYDYVDKMMKKKKKFEFDMKVIIYSLCIPATFFRILWAIDPHSNSAPFGTHPWRRSNGGNILVVIFVKTTQILGVAAATLMILIWKQIVDAAQKMKRVKGQSDLYYYCAGSAFAITIIELPLCLGGAIFAAGSTKSLASMLDLIANGIFGVSSKRSEREEKEPPTLVLRAMKSKGTGVDPGQNTCRCRAAWLYSVLL